MEDKYYSIQEVANLLKVAYLTVYRWVQVGRLKAYRVGKQYRIKRIDLNGALKSYSKYGGK